MTAPPRSTRTLRAALATALAVILCAADGAAFAGPKSASSRSRPGDAEAARKRATTEPPLLAGAALREITPAVGGDAAAVTLAGFGEGRLAAGVRDPIGARALVLESGGAAFGILVFDLFAVGREDAQRIREGVRGRLQGTPLAGLLVVATGTRFGPDLRGTFSGPGGAVDPAWRTRLAADGAAAVEEAWRQRKPARLSFATARLPRLLEDGRRPLRLDDQAWLLRVEDAASGLGIAALAEFAALPETLPRSGREISADWPAGAVAALEAAFGGIGLVLPGAQGGRMLPAHEPGGPGEFGAAVARPLVVAWSGRHEGAAPMPQDVTRGAISFRARTLTVPDAGRGERTTEIAFLRLASGGEPVLDLACVPGIPFPELVNGGIESPQDSGSDLQGAPPETALRSLMPAPIKMVAGGCGDDLGEILPASEWDARPPFAYGLESAPPGEERSAGPQTAPLLWRAFAELMR